MPVKGNAIAIYSRKSKFTGKGESIGNQIEMCKEYIEMHFGREALDRVEVFEDEGFSGGNLNRPDFKRMMSAVKKHKFSMIVVYRLDRISRNISDFAGLIEELDRLGVAFVSLREQFDTNSPMGRAMMYITSVFSQLERETIAERIRDNMHELAKTGRWLGGNTPTGYESEAVSSVTIDGKTKRCFKLKLIPEEAELIRKIYDTYIETDSQTKTEEELYRLNLKSRNGRVFTRYTIKTILQNPVYMVADEEAYNYFIKNGAEVFAEKAEFDGTRAVMAYNRTDQGKGRCTVMKPINEWIVAVGEHQGIVSGKEWVRIQESLGRNKAKSYRKPRINNALLTGILYCSCGAHMYPKLNYQWVDGNKEHKYWYLCRMKELSRMRDCNTRNPSGNALDLAVIEQIKRMNSDGTIAELLEKGRREFIGDRTGFEDKLIEAKKKKAETEKKMDALVDSLAELGEGGARARITKRIDTLNEELDLLEAQIKEYEKLAVGNGLNESEFELLAQMLSSFSANIDNMTVEQKRMAIRMIVRKIVWDGENAHVYLFGSEGEADLPFEDSTEASFGPRCEDSERNTHVDKSRTKARGRSEP